MMMRKTSSLCVLLLFFVATARADKDDSYYIPGTGNPNTQESMYWKDAENVLQDLSKFSSLYVEFHQCAWTWMHYDEEEDNDVEENDYWYMGKIPPMGANVAFSLYGRLKGRTFNGCSSDTFINSFYTTTGFEVFAKAMYSAGVSGFGVYSYGDGDDDSTSYLSSDCLGYKGVGCDSNYGFALHTYSTALCDPQKASGVKDKLAYLNNAMKASQCIKIYDSSSSSSYNEGDDDAQEQQDDSSPLSLLYHSSACFYQNFWSPDGECPDPYGKIKNYQQNFYKGIQASKMQRPVAVYRQKKIYEAEIRKGQSRLAIGVVCVATAILLLIVDKILSVCRKRRERAKVTRKVAQDAMLESVGSTSPSQHSYKDFEYRTYG